MSAPYVPPCRCPDDGPHKPSCPHFDAAHDPAADAPLSERSMSAAIHETGIDPDRVVARLRLLLTPPARP